MEETMPETVARWMLEHLRCHACLWPLFRWGTAVHEKRKCFQDVAYNLFVVEDRIARLYQRHQILSVVVPIGLLSKVRDVRGCRREDYWGVVADQHHAAEELWSSADHTILRSLIEFGWSVQVPSGGWSEPPRVNGVSGCDSSRPVVLG